MISYRPKVYTASKLFQWTLWAGLYNDPEWAHVDWTARWVQMANLEGTATPADFGHFWTIDIQDVQRSDFVLLYGGLHSNQLRGALFEAGAGVALGKTVLAVALPETFPIEHSWSYHPLVVRLPSLSEAAKFLHRYAIPRTL